MTMTKKKSRKSPKKRTPQPKRVSRTKKPDEMSLEAWQVELRRQFGRDQNFSLKNVGEEKFFSEFLVKNPETGNSYRVAIRGKELGNNFCSCPDYATNHLGTCKHLEFTLAQLERKRGGKKAFEEGFQPEYSEVFLQYGAERRVVFRPGTECPPELARLAGKYFDDEGILEPNSFAKFQTFLSKASEIDHDFRCYDDALNFVARVRDGEQRQKHLSDLFPVGTRSAHFKKLLRVPLYDYQREGALFAARAGRCLIGDEMGLGKTIQALAAAEILGQEFGVEKVLIVCPTSLKHQWKREIEKFTRRDATVVEGLLPDRLAAYREESFFKIVNYDIVYRDLDFIRQLAPDLVILDEAQRIKNWETRTAKSVKQIDTPFAIVLTGTPLENRLEELVSIVQFVDRHRLGPTYRFLHEHQEHEEETGRVIGYKNLDKVGETLKPVLIRRQKKDVLDQLPARLEKNLFVPMTQQQAKLHEEHRETVARIVLKWRRYGFLTETDQRILMSGLQLMRMSCNSTFLVDHETDFSTKPDELLTILRDVLETRENKVVIFSQWTRTHELITRRMNGTDWGHVFFHGGVPSRKRKNLIEQFREDPGCRLFLSTDAGGVGLNLQHANVIVNMDLPWNPAVLEQRIGRVHRLGQTRPVQVINFVAEGTIEEGMLGTLAFKKSLFAGILDGGEKEVFLGESRLKRFMDTVEKVTTGIPQTPPQPEPEPEDEPRRRESSPGRQEAPESPQPAENPFNGLLQQGLAFLEQLTAAANSSNGKQRTNQSRNGSALETGTDERTGQTFLKVPLPEPDILNQAYAAIQNFMESMRK